MEKIHFQDDHKIMGKTVKEVEESLKKTQGKYQFLLQWKHLFLNLSMVVLLLSLAGAAWNLKNEVIALQTEVLRLSEENALLQKRIDAQINQAPSVQEGGLQVNKEPGEFFYHEIRPNDCFEIISKRYYGTDEYAPELARINGMTVDSTLHIGQIVKVPKDPGKLRPQEPGPA